VKEGLILVGVIIEGTTFTCQKTNPVQEEEKKKKKPWS
jgi:hypothetical protein